MPYVMYDSVNAADFPASGFQVTAGYVAGRYPSSKPILARFPNIPHLTIAVTARQDADCLDVEPGDATPAEAPGWFDRQKARGVAVPVIYCMASWIGQVKAAMGNRNYLLWSAHYNGVPHICGTHPSCNYPKVDATQWADKGPRGENVDQSLLSDHFYTTITNTGDDDMPSSQEVAHAVWDMMLERGPAKGPAWSFVVGAADSKAVADGILAVLRSDEAKQVVRDQVDVTLRTLFNNPSDGSHGELYGRVIQACNESIAQNGLGTQK